MNKNYDPKFKQEAINLALHSEQTYRQTANDLGINYKTFCNWMYQTISKHPPVWAMDTHMESTLVCQALTTALLHLGYPSKVIVHSDRCGQYCYDDYQSILTTDGLTCSMSRKGNFWNNAVAESFFHTLKTKCIYRHKLESMEQVKSMILWHIEVYYNRVRKHSYLNYLSPIQFEEKMM